MSASGLPQCHKCGSGQGPWRPSGETLPSGEQLLVCKACTQLAAAVDLMGGALPMPVGTADEDTMPRPRRFLSGSPLEDQHDGPLSHTYETPRDLPAPGGTNVR